MDDEDDFPPVLETTTKALGAYVTGPRNGEIGRGCSYCMQGNIPPDTARWIAALSPAVAPHLEMIFREYARCTAELHYPVDEAPEGKAVLALARAVLREGAP